MNLAVVVNPSDDHVDAVAAIVAREPEADVTRRLDLELEGHVVLAGRPEHEEIVVEDGAVLPFHYRLGALGQQEQRRRQAKAHGRDTPRMHFFASCVSFLPRVDSPSYILFARRRRSRRGGVNRAELSHSICKERNISGPVSRFVRFGGIGQRCAPASFPTAIFGIVLCVCWLSKVELNKLNASLNVFVYIELLFFSC